MLSIRRWYQEYIRNKNAQLRPLLKDIANACPPSRKRPKHVWIAIDRRFLEGGASVSSFNVTAGGVAHSCSLCILGIRIRTYAVSLLLDVNLGQRRRRRRRSERRRNRRRRRRRRRPTDRRRRPPPGERQWPNRPPPPAAPTEEPPRGRVAKRCSLLVYYSSRDAPPPPRIPPRGRPTEKERASRLRGTRRYLVPFDMK